MEIMSEKKSIDAMILQFGYVQMCAWCKRVKVIEDGQPSWVAIKEEDARYTTSLFSHGICPDCKQELETQSNN